jgi:hypothetical protein
MRLFGLFGVLLLAVLVIRLLMKSSQAAAVPLKKPEEAFRPDRYNTAPLPTRSAAELTAQQSALRGDWVTYVGATPPLRLKLQGQSYESYRRVARNHINVIGQERFERMSPSEQVAASALITADAYVKDWDGAAYQNGSPMPFSVKSMATMMLEDPHLMAFVTDEAAKLSPPWPAR